MTLNYEEMLYVQKGNVLKKCYRPTLIMPCSNQLVFLEIVKCFLNYNNKVSVKNTMRTKSYHSHKKIEITLKLNYTIDLI